MNQPIEREEMEMDVLLVGAGPANLALAIHLQQLVEAHNKTAETALAKPEIYMIEKGTELGHHQLSGCVMDPIGIEELLPDWRESGFPVEADVAADQMLQFKETGQKKRWVPRAMRNRGKVIVCLNQVVKWMGAKAEEMGVNIFPGFAGAEMLMDGDRVRGVRTRDAGIDKWGERKSSFEPGMDLIAKVTVLGEGVRGSLAKHLIPKLKLDHGRNPQLYQIGCKEIWRLSDEGKKHLGPGDVYHTMKWPVPKGVFGGGFIYGMANGQASIGLVIGLDYKDPNLDPHACFQKWKTHPFLKRILEGGELLRYGAKSIPDGGYFSQPKLTADGLMLVGDTAGFLNSMRLKGVHLAIKSGMLAARTIFESLKADDFSAARLHGYQEAYEKSWAKKELWGIRNFRQGWQRGELFGLINTGIGLFTGGRGIFRRLSAREDHLDLNQVETPGTTSPVPKSTFDDKLTFNKLKDVYFSGTKHEEDQPCHLEITDPDICISKCTREYGNPCQHFCPANVYEILPKAEARGSSPQLNEAGEGKATEAGDVLKINASNCVHCRTCDIKDPYQIINWVVPEGGGGPVYTDM